MKNANTQQTPGAIAETANLFRPPVETRAAILEARLEAAGQRMTVYLRNLPLHERSRHELALMALSELAKDPGDNSAEAETRGMRILRGLLAEQTIPLFTVPGPPLKRVHMKPEEMDRRPWVRASLRVWQPIRNTAAFFFNTSLIDFFLYALLLAGLYFLGTNWP